MRGWVGLNQYLRSEMLTPASNCARRGPRDVGHPGGMTREQLVEFYRLMYLSRRTDDREIVLKRQQKIFFQVSCAGHEALLVAAGMAMRPGTTGSFRTTGTARCA